MEQSPRLSLSYVAPAQAQKHVTVNETFRRLDAVVQLTVRSRNVSAEPAAPAEGDAYVLPLGATGLAWDGFAGGNLAVYQDGAWAEIAAVEGVRAYAVDEGALIVFDGAVWKAVSAGASGGGGETAPRFGVNAAADDVNRLAVKSDAVLFSHDDATPGSGDCRVKVNKQAPGGTASHLFQTGFSGRAEFGLTGDDDFRVKVSPDGSSWADAICVDKDSGYVGLGASSPRARLHVQMSPSGIPDTEIFSDVAVAVERNGAASLQLISGNGSTAYLYFADPDSGWPGAVYYAHGSDEMRFRANAGLRMTLKNGLRIGSPTGGDRGAGALNAHAVYDDNMLLSCYVFDQALDGDVDEAKWDDKVPDRHIPEVVEFRENVETGETARLKTEGARVEQRRHEPMRRFIGRIGGAHDPLTLDGYARHWREKRHLTSMPNEAAYDPERGLSTGEWVQRLVETVEIQAVLIEALNARVKDVEARMAETPPPEEAGTEGLHTEGERR